MSDDFAPVCIACKARRDDWSNYDGVPDPCLGTLPGVTWACCGHGYAEQSYVVTEAGATLHGEAARSLQVAAGGTPAPFGAVANPYTDQWVDNRFGWICGALKQVAS